MPNQTIATTLQLLTEQLSNTEIYYGHGMADPAHEAYALICHVCQLPWNFAESEDDRLVTAEQQQQLELLLKQRSETRKPLAYLINTARFAELAFYIDEHVLVPRSPLAELIEQRFVPWIQPDKIKNILEIGTGSGCIAIACAHYCNEAEVTACDISLDALAVAEKNVTNHDLVKQVKLYQSDVFASLPNKQYDIILSNPPYVGQAEYQGLPQEYGFEPVLGLVAENNGMAIVERILAQAAQYLTEHGILIVEVGNTAALLEQSYPHLPFIWLEFTRGGEGVFLLRRNDLLEHLG